MDLATLKDVADVVTGFATVAALAVGAAWTYFLFIRHRLRYPKAEIELLVDNASIPPDKRLVHVTMRVSSSGAILLAPKYAELRLRQVAPVPEELIARLRPGIDPVEPGRTELTWPMIAGREWNWDTGGFEIEPGESDAVEADFVISSDVKTIQIYAFVRNPKKEDKGLGWTVTALCSFD